MKYISLNRLLTITLILLFSGFSGAYADKAVQEENTRQDNPNEIYLDNVKTTDTFCQNNPLLDFIILDQYDRIITQGKCGDVMVKFFLRISDPLLQVDNTRYFRLSYENPSLMDQKIILK